MTASGKISGWRKASVILAAMLLTQVFVVSGMCDDLGETDEVVYSGDRAKALRDKAAELASAASIYEYVRNEFEYALYHGSRSGSINTFLGRRGNDVDMASTLIAMLRSQNIRSRYAVATVKVASEKVMNWLGVEDLDLTVSIMKDQGIQKVDLSPDRTWVEFEHAWVEALVPFHNYRGIGFDVQVNCTSESEKCHWISLDPSFKQMTYKDNTIDIYDAVDFDGFDYDRYYDAIKDNDELYKDKNPREIYEELILDYLKTYYPGKTLEDVADTGLIIHEQHLALPASLPYEIVSTVRRYDSVDEHDNSGTETKDWVKNVTLDVAKQASDGTPDPSVVMFSNKKFKLAELTTRRLTLTFEACGANCVLSKFRLDGEPKGATLIATGSLNWWDPFVIDITVDGAPGAEQGQPDNTISVRYQNNYVGGYYLIGTGGDVSNWSQVHRAADELLAANETYAIINDQSGVPYVDEDRDGVIDPEEIQLLEHEDGMDALTGGLMYTAMNLYFAKFRDEIARLDALNHVISPINGFVGIVSSVYDIEYLDETAFSVMPGGLLIDMKGQEFSGMWRSNAAEVAADKHFELIGHVMSSLEHEVWQELTGYDAVSTVRGFQMSIADNGASILNPKKNDTEDTLPGLYPTFGFGGQAPSPFQLQLLGAGDDLFGTRPATWSHPTGGDEYFVLFKEIVSPSTSALRLNGWTVKAHGSTSGPYVWTDCVNNWENAIIDFIATYGGGATISTGSVFCDGTSFNGWTGDAALNYIEQFFDNTLKPVIFGEDFFNYCDENLSGEPFIPSDYAYRSYPGSSDQYSSSLIISIRDNLYTISSSHWQEFLIPSQKPSGGLYRFVVYIKKTHEQGTDKLTGLSFSIMNDYGGGYVEESGGTLIPAESLDEFNNEVFTDKNLVMQANNNTIITPSTIDPVSTVTGNMYHDETDVVIKGRGLDMVFTRTYNSGLSARNDTDLPLSKGWTHSYNMRLTSNDYNDTPNDPDPNNNNSIVSSITYFDERGGEVIFTVDGDGATWAIGQPRGVFDALSLDDPVSGQHTITFRNGVKYIFEGIGGANMRTVGDTARLKIIQDPYGNKLTLTYDGNGRLTNISDNLGRTGLTLTYHPDDRLQTVSDWTGRTWTYTYQDDNLTSVTNPTTNAISYTYHDGTHLLNDIILPEDRTGEQVATAFSYFENNRAFNYANQLGHTEFMDYDLYRKRTRITDPRGFVREHTYDEDGTLVKLTEPDNGVLLFENTVDGLRFSKTDALGYDTEYSYLQSGVIDGGQASDTYGNVTLEKDHYDNTVQYQYNYTLYDQITQVTDKNGNQRRYTYYPNTIPGSGEVKGKLKMAEAMIDSQWEKLEEYTYYDNGNLKQKTVYIDKDYPSKIRVTDYTYDAYGLNLMEMIVTGQPGGESYTIDYTYDNLGRKETETLTRRTSPTDPTPLQLVTTYEYDDLDRVIRITDPMGNIAETIYDANGKVFQEKVHHKIPGGGYDIRTYVTREYDAADRLIKETDIDDNETHYEYDAAGNLIKVTDANGHITQYEYDPMNRRTAVIDANGHRTETVYDLAGNVIKTIDANGHATQQEYDALGRKEKDISSLGFETQYEYDANGNLKKLIDANAVAGLQPKHPVYQSTVYNEYDEFNRLVKTVDALNGETSYAYDLLGNVTHITDAENHTTEFVYDNLGRLKEVIDPIHETPTDKTVTFTYDEAGNVLTRTDRTGRMTRYTYDELNRLRLAEYLTDGTSETFTYDMYGDLTGVSNNAVTYTYGYDAQHRMLSKTDNRLNRTLSWVYDGVGNVIEKTDYQDEVTEYRYDSTNRLVSLRNQAYLQVSYHYDPAGRLLNRILSNRARTDYRYDDDNRLVELTNRSVSDKLSMTQTYGHDRIGNITSITDTSGTVDFTYDPLYRLTDADYPGTANDVSYTYDDVGNRLTMTNAAGTLYYIYNNDGNRLDEIRQGSAGGPIQVRYVYDDNGNRIEKRDESDTVVQYCFYDQKNRVTTLMTATDTYTFQYDPNDYRIRKSDGTNANQYLMEGEHYEAVYDQTDTIKAKYLRGVVVDEIVNGYYYDAQGAKNNYTFHHDHLQSVTALTGHNGDEEQTVKFGPFGGRISTTGTSPNILGYTGRELDSETGLYYYRARYYDPKIGRFLSEDPLGFEAGVNFYTYVQNNPINANDPSGLVVQIYASDAFGIPGANHVYVYSTETKTGVGRAGSSGWTRGDGIGTPQPTLTNPQGDPGIEVTDLGGLSEKEFMQKVIEYPGWNKGIYFPEIDDCHTQLQEAFEYAGASYPGWPTGRFDWDEQIGNAVNTVIDKGQQLWQQTTDFFGGGNSSASGGFVLYPNKPNTNMMKAVYSK